MAKSSVIFFLASIGSARWLRPNTARSAHSMYACEKDCSLTDQFHDDAWDGKLETANVRPQHRIIKYLISNLFDPIFLFIRLQIAYYVPDTGHHIKSEILTFQHNSSGSARAGGLTFPSIAQRLRGGKG